MSALASTGLIAMVQAYRLAVAPLLSGACRFTPSCSTYFIQAVQTHGCLRGTTMGLWRICRCNPWAVGGYDPVPPAGPSTPPDGESGVE